MAESRAGSYGLRIISHHFQPEWWHTIHISIFPVRWAKCFKFSPHLRCNILTAMLVRMPPSLPNPLFLYINIFYFKRLHTFYLFSLLFYLPSLLLSDTCTSYSTMLLYPLISYVSCYVRCMCGANCVETSKSTRHRDCRLLSIQRITLFNLLLTQVLFCLFFRYFKTPVTKHL